MLADIGCMGGLAPCIYIYYLYMTLIKDTPSWLLNIYIYIVSIIYNNIISMILLGKHVLHSGLVNKWLLAGILSNAGGTVAYAHQLVPTVIHCVIINYILHQFTKWNHQNFHSLSLGLLSVDLLIAVHSRPQFSSIPCIYIHKYLGEGVTYNIL